MNSDVGHDGVLEPVPPGVHVGDPKVVDERIRDGVDSTPLVAGEVSRVVVRHRLAVATAEDDRLKFAHCTLSCLAHYSWSLKLS